MSDIAAHHRLHVTQSLGALNLDVRLELHAPWTLLFGPSGTGKSSLLRAAAGLLPGPGVQIDRRRPDGSWLPLQYQHFSTPTHRRGIRWAPQRPSLFPHLSVRENIAFGDAGQPEIDAAVNLFRVAPLLDRMPRALSGGEAQRVNLARAFANRGCHLLLLDEPFAGVDHTLRDELLPRMRDWLQSRRIPVLSVSHDVEEALQLGAHVVVLHEGRITVQGPAAEVLYAERARMLANLRPPALS